MSQGLKPYSKLINFEVPNAGKIYVNTAKEYKNAHIVIPLFNSDYTDGINLSLIMSLNDFKNEVDTGYCNYMDINEFGNGARLNLLKKLKRFTCNSIEFYVQECDFSINYYNFTNESGLIYINNIIGNDYFKNNSDRNEYYEYHDENDNILYFENDPLDGFSSIYQKYPSVVYSKVGDYDKYILEFNDKNCISTIIGHSGEKAIFEMDNDNELVTKIEILRLTSDGEYAKYHTIMFEYSNNIISKIKHTLYDETNTTYSASYTYLENNHLIISDDLSKYSIKLNLNYNNEIISIMDGYDGIYNGNINYNLSYYNLKTVITDNNFFINNDEVLRKIEHHFINHNGYYLPYYDYDHIGIVRCYSYQTDKNLISFDSGNILVYGCDIACDKNIITNGNLQNDEDLFDSETNGALYTCLYDDTFDRDDCFKAIYFYDAENYVTRTVNYNGTKNDKLIFSMWGLQQL